MHNELRDRWIAFYVVDLGVVELRNELERNFAARAIDNVWLQHCCYVVCQWIVLLHFALSFVGSFPGYLLQDGANLMNGLVCHCASLTWVIYARPNTAMYVYLIGYTTQQNKIHTYIGVTADFEARFQEHNGINGPKHTRLAAGKWFPVMVLDVPETMDVEVLENNWKRSTRGVESRIAWGFQAVKKHTLIGYVADLDIGLLKQMPEGKVKKLGRQFWDSI